MLLIFILWLSSGAGALISTCSNYLINNSSLMSLAMSWLVAGAITLSSLSSSSKKSILWSVSFMVLMASFQTKSLLGFYILFEVSLVPIMIMILFWGSQPERLSASVYFLMYTSIFSVPYMLLVLMMSCSFLTHSVLISSTIMVLVMVAPFLVKMPIIGLHFWLPKAHVEASTSGSMILAGVLLKLGSYGIYRVTTTLNLFHLLNSSSLWILAAIYSSMVTFLQTDLKKLVAYSSVTHMTFLMISLSLNNKLFYFNCLVLSLAHGWTSMGMFFIAGSSCNNANSRLAFTLSSEMKFHWFMLMLGLVLITNAGLPPFPSFFSELMCLSSSMSNNLIILSFILYSTSVCYYNTYLWMWVAHFKSQETTALITMNSEALIAKKTILLSASTLMWIMVS